MTACSASINIIQNTLKYKDIYYTFILNCAATHIHAEPPEGEVREHGAMGPHAEGGKLFFYKQS